MRRRLKQLASCICVFAILSWIALSPRVSPGLYSAKLFKPQWGKGSMQELRAFNKFENHETWFRTPSGTMLHGWIFKNPTSSRIILFHPGNAGDIAKRLPLIEYLLASGASVFIYEPRGFGLSRGTPSIDSICADGLAAYDELARRGYKPNQIVIYGESLGASVATYVSSQRQAAGIILQSGFASLERIAKEQVSILKIYPSFMFPQPRLDNAGLMSRKHPPLLIMHGERDTIINISHSEELFARASGIKKFVRFHHSGHSDVQGGDLELFLHTVNQFLSDLP